MVWYNMAWHTKTLVRTLKKDPDTLQASYDVKLPVIWDAMMFMWHHCNVQMQVIGNHLTELVNLKFPRLHMKKISQVIQPAP